MRTRLRPAYTPEQLKLVYSNVYPDWIGHPERRRVTAQLAMSIYSGEGLVVDLSCRDGAIEKMMTIPDGKLMLGDLMTVGPMEEALMVVPHCELFICSETLEHLDDPDWVLRQIRLVSDKLILSTPCDEPNAASNIEHYWSWGADDVEAMLVEAGFTNNQLTLCTPHGFTFQIWRCE